MTTGELEHIRQMANQIAANFSFHSDQVERIGNHLTLFWAPSMRALLTEYVEQGGEGLEAAVLEAVRQLQAG